MAKRPTPRRDPEPPSYRLVLSPRGLVHVEADPEPGHGVPLRSARKLTRAFERSSAHGLLHLGAARMPADLPPSLAFWQRLGHLFIARFCASTASTERGGERQPLEVARSELEELVRTAPELVGGEYLTTELLAALWREIEAALLDEGARSGGVQAFLTSLNPAWHLVGRVCFHLAENKRNASRPFAFMATYASAIYRGDKVQHKPLGAALREYEGDRERLLALLEPVQRAARHSELVAELVASKAVFQAQAWTPDKAWRFLMEVPRLEESGVVVRVPDWWHPDPRRRSRVMATVTIGAPTDGLLGLDSMLEFEVRSGLVLIKGRWVEVDQEKLGQALAHWKEIESRVAEHGARRELRRRHAAAGQRAARRRRRERTRRSRTQLVGGRLGSPAGRTAGEHP